MLTILDNDDCRINSIVVSVDEAATDGDNAGMTRVITKPMVSIKD